MCHGQLKKVRIQRLLAYVTIMMANRSKPEYIKCFTRYDCHKAQRCLLYSHYDAGFAVGFWPLPEAFWPDVNAPSLPQRSAHPNVNFTCTNQEPMIIDNLPFDKYELEPSPLTLYILARKQPKVCWQVYIQGSSKASEAGHPFGYLKASTNLLSVNLFVLPYNYPMLLPLLDDLFKVKRVLNCCISTVKLRNANIVYHVL